MACGGYGDGCGDGGDHGGGSLLSVCGQSLSTPAKHLYFTYLLNSKTIFSQHLIHILSIFYYIYSIFNRIYSIFNHI